MRETSLRMRYEVGSSRPIPSPMMMRPTSTREKPLAMAMAAHPAVTDADAAIRVLLRPSVSARGKLSRLPTIIDAVRMLTAE